MQTLYPLTQSQQLMLQEWKYSLQKQVLNTCVMLYFDEAIDHRLMMQAIQLAMERNDATFTRLCKENGEYMQYFSLDAPERIEVVDASDKTENEFADMLEKWAAAPFPNHGLDVQLYAVKLVRRPNGLWGMYWCASQLIFDGYALMNTGRDILSIYSALKNGKPMPKPMPSCLPAYNDDFAYMNSGRHQGDKAYFMDEVFSTEPMFTTLNGKDSSECRKGKRYGEMMRPWLMNAGQIDRRIPAGLNAQVNAFATEYHISPQAIYLLALRTYLMLTNDTEDVTFLSMVARRATVNQKRAGGTMMLAVPFRSVISRDTSFREAALYMGQCQSKYYRHANVSAQDVMQELGDRNHIRKLFGYANIGIAYQPYFRVTEDMVSCHFRRICCGTGTLPLFMIFMPMDNSGDIWANYTYVKGYIKPESIESFHRFLLRFLDVGTSNPNIPVAEICHIN